MENKRKVNEADKADEEETTAKNLGQ